MRGLVSPGPREEVRGTFSQSRLDGRNPRGCQNLEAWFDDPHQLLPSRITLAVAIGNAVLLGFVSLKISMLFSTPGGWSIFPRPALHENRDSSPSSETLFRGRVRDASVEGFHIGSREIDNRDDRRGKLDPIPRDQS